MTNLTPVSSLDDVVEHPTTESVLAGPGGPMNQQAQSLLNRTKFLDDKRLDLSNTADVSKGMAVIGRGGQVVKTIAELRALLITSVSKHAFVTGYYVQGDGGGGPYWYDSTDTTSADNGGTIIVATDGGRWKLVATGSVSVKQFGAKFDGIADATANIQKALDAVLIVDFGSPSDSYKLTNKLTLRTGHQLYGNNCTITQTAIRTEVFRFDSKTDIYITGFRGVGLGTDFNDSPSSLAVAVRGVSSSRIMVENNEFTNFSCAAVFFDFAADCTVKNNKIIGPGTPILTPITSGACYGIVVDGDRMLVTGNIISQTAQGVATGDAKKIITISYNEIFEVVGQHGIYAGSGLTNLNIIGNDIFDIELIGIKVQNFDTPATHADNVIVANNTVMNTGSQGIAVLSTTPSAVYKFRNVAVTGNTVRNAGEDGMNFGDIIAGNISGNSVHNAGREGITMGRLNGVKISNNTIQEAARNGIRESEACSACIVSHNTIKDCSSALAVGERNGILIQLGDSFTIDGNIIVDTAANMQYGIFISGGVQTSDAVRFNICKGMTDVGARFKSPVEALLSIEGNYFSGTLGSSLNQPFTDQHGRHDRYFVSTAAPTTGTWELGDVVYVRTPALLGFIGFVCTVAGTPGNWVPFGHLARIVTSVFDPPSIANGASTTVTLAASGAAIGDMVAASFSNSLAGLTLTGYINAAGSVTGVFANNTGAAVDLASGTVKFSITKTS